MKVALIPPVSLLEKYGQGDFHLILAHLCEVAKYRAHYRKQKREGAYIILDNSAHEQGAGQSAMKLAFLAESMVANEVVVPDVLFDAERTISKCLEAHEIWYEGDDETMSILQPRLMYVPQGRTRTEWALCLQELLRLHLYSSKKYNVMRDFTLGVSKDYEEWQGGLDALIADYVRPLVDNLHLKHIRMHVHLLGWGRDLWALGILARKYPWIRSTDSAKPFVYGYEGWMLNPDASPPPYPGRPIDYFTGKRKYIKSKHEVVNHNIKIFKALASGEL